MLFLVSLERDASFFAIRKHAITGIYPIHGLAGRTKSNSNRIFDNNDEQIQSLHYFFLKLNNYQNQRQQSWFTILWVKNVKKQMKVLIFFHHISQKEIYTIPGVITSMDGK